jgi:hypothetical protein
MDSVSQSALAIVAALVIGVAVFLVYAAPLLFFNSTNYPSWIFLFLGPLLATLISCAFLFLSQLSEKEKADPLTVFRNSTIPGVGVALFLLAPFFLSFLRNAVGSAVPNVYSLTPEQLIIESKLRSTEELQAYTDLLNRKQATLDDGISYSYFSFWGSLFGTMLGMTFL